MKSNHIKRAMDPGSNESVFSDQRSRISDFRAVEPWQRRLKALELAKILFLFNEILRRCLNHLVLRDAAEGFNLPQHTLRRGHGAYLIPSLRDFRSCFLNAPSIAAHKALIQIVRHDIAAQQDVKPKPPIECDRIGNWVAREAAVIFVCQVLVDKGRNGDTLRRLSRQRIQEQLSCVHNRPSSFVLPGMVHCVTARRTESPYSAQTSPVPQAIHRRRAPSDASRQAARSAPNSPRPARLDGTSRSRSRSCC
ncbi:hypothetical protein SDC9_87329 [bioreactor metagenome]|uniref:Uncharacterized protein n=1 Tax=bioreactor metagenome TaxID=1076179 RepID=A0A644ZPT9_9ZZZZ